MSKAALEGERKQVTVLFADLKGSMELLADRDPEEARKILDPVLERMMEAVHRYEGTVNQVMGDGIMALFGAPLAHEDHAVRACYAALRMQEAVRKYAEELHRREGIPIQIRVGVNSGEVVVRSIGSDLHMDYTAVGQTTHLAARMEQMAMAGSILLSADALRLAEGFVEVKPIGPVNVKGLRKPVEVYELAGASARRSRLQVAAARGLSRFVGRDAEIEHLRRALEHAAHGRGQVAAVMGEPGVGKSRLTFELTHSHRVDGWLVLEAGAVSYGKATSYLPLIDLLKGYFHIDDRDTPREVSEKVTGKILTLDRALEPTLPALLALLDVGEDPEWKTLDPPQRRQQTLNAVKRLFLREAQVQPLLVVFEDLHWIDPETQAFLDGLVESLPSARLLLLINYRPEYEHHWGSKTSYTQVRLDPLPPESARELLRGLLGEDATVASLESLVTERTEGNPFFLEESVRALVETGALAGERGAYRLAAALTDVQVPPTVQTILAARIDRLPPEEKRLLQSAAVIGKDVPFALLMAIADQPEDALRRGLGHLQAAEFLYETSLFPDAEYTFKHALTHDVAYGSLLQERRRQLHARIASAIEGLHADRLDEHIERLAHHAARAEVWGRAMTYLRRAGARAVARSANREGVSYLGQALAALAHLPESRETIEAGIDIRLMLRLPLLMLDKNERIVDYLREAEVLATKMGDQPRRGLATSLLTNYFYVAGDYPSALECAERAADVAEVLEDAALRNQVNFFRGLVVYALGDYARAAELLRPIVAGHEPHYTAGARRSNLLDSGTLLVRCLCELGEFTEGIACGEAVVRAAEAADISFSRAYAYVGLGSAYLRKGDHGRAIAVLEIGLDLCRARDIALWRPHVASILAQAYARAARVGEALSVLDGVAWRASTYAEAFVNVTRGEVYLLTERRDEAVRLAGRALQIARGRGERGREAWTLRLLAEIAANAEPTDATEAEAQFYEAVTLASMLGMRPLVAHCHLGLGKLYRRTGKHEKAQEHLTTATTMYREMGMTYWLEQAETEMRELT
jgi:class 3 adenylate cyclase/tetratricopeptide (TPR) repeat protein